MCGNAHTAQGKMRRIKIQALKVSVEGRRRRREKWGRREEGREVELVAERTRDEVRGGVSGSKPMGTLCETGDHSRFEQIIDG